MGSIRSEAWQNYVRMKPDMKVLKLVRKTGPLTDPQSGAQPATASQPTSRPKAVPQDLDLAEVAAAAEPFSSAATATAHQVPQAKEQHERPRLSREQMIAIYRTMYLSRKIDDKEIQLKAQNKIFFQISGAGHEAVQVAAGMVLKPGYDWFYPYYRDRALCLQLGMTPLEQLLAAVGAEKDPNSHGRQMPSHWGLKRLNIVSQSSPTGTQLLQAVGCAEAGYRIKLIKELEERVQSFHADEVAYVSLGDGTSSEGECWEALNTACNLKLPVLFLLEDNGYAISVPVEVQTPGGDVSRLVENFPNLLIERCDGTDVLASYTGMERAVRHCREGLGPALVHAKVIRPYSHSLSDDERLYRPDEERIADSERDPVKRFGALLIEEGIINQEGLQGIKDHIDKEVSEAADQALASPQPAPDTARLYVFSPDVDPCSQQFDTEGGAALSGNADDG